MQKIIGIDLGTTNSLVAVMDDRRATVIPNLMGKLVTPSVVRIMEDGRYIVGENAAKHLISDSLNTISGIKRFIGRRYNEVVDLAANVPFDVVLGENNYAAVNIHGIDYTPEAISAMILQYLKLSAQEYLGDSVTQAVITVPAYFSDLQRQATKKAGRLAGLEFLRIINEPTAASLAYGLEKVGNERIVVFDLGGGTFDLSLLEVGDGVFEVLSIVGDGFLGGDDFDDRLIQWILDEIRLVYGIDLSTDSIARQMISESAKRAKCELSEIPEAHIRIPNLIQKDGESITVDLLLTNSMFNDICEELFDRLILPCEQAMKYAKLVPKDITNVILVGGATRMKKVADVIQSVFRTAPSRSVNPDEAVALGAAIQAGIFDGDIKDILLLDINPHSLGLEDMVGSTEMMIRLHSTIPTKKTEVFTTSLDGQTSVEIHILEGEGKLAVDNRTLGHFVLDGIPLAPKGVPQIEVSFDIDANGILSVVARERSTGIEKGMTIELQIKNSTEEFAASSVSFWLNAVSHEKMIK